VIDPAAESLLTRLAAFVQDVRVSLPAPVVDDVHDRVLDVVGNSFAAHLDDAALAVATVATELGGKREATELLARTRVPAPSAALINGTLAHALDFDDTHLRSILHPSASVIPAALAVAEVTQAEGPRLASAIAAGLEVCIRVGDAGVDLNQGDSIFFERGLHATAICGALGAAAASASLMGLDSSRIAHAIAIASSMGAGILEANRTGGSVKRVHCGWAAHAGVMAALLAKAGISGPTTVLEGRFGFLQAHLGDRWNAAAITGGLGEEWELLNAVYKPYPTNHFTHAPIDAALALRKTGLETRAIAAIELGVPEPTLRTIAEPVEAKAAPSTGYAAKFSGPFTVSAALLGGGGLGVYLTDFDDAAVLDAEHRRLAGLVRCVPDEASTSAFPERFGAVLRVTLSSGQLLEHRIVSSRGGPGNPLPANELIRKFQLNLEYGGVGAASHAIEEAIHGVTGRHGPRQLLRTLRSASTTSGGSRSR